MSATVLLPSSLRDLNAGRSMVELPAATGTVGEALRALHARHPAVYQRLVTERGELRPHVNLFVGGGDIRWSGGLETPLPDGAELVVLPAVSGG